MSSRHAFALVVAAAALAACSDPTTPDPTHLDEVLGQVAEVETYSAMGAVAAGVPMMSSHHGAASACAFTAATATFVCPPFTHNGMTMQRSYQLLDAAGTPQTAFDPATTAAVRAVIDVSGTPMNGPGGGVTLHVTHHSDQTVGGLLTTTRTVSGTSTTEYEFTDSDGSFTVTSLSETNLTLPPTGTVNGYPTGTITYEMTNSDGGSAMTMTTTFNGTSIATLTQTFAGVTRTCTIDLAKPAQAPVCS